MSLTTTFLDELRARTTLSTLIGRTVKVTKAGREFKACCPFHNEKSPSFTINDEKGFYHCFGCGAHGDAIRWMIARHAEAIGRLVVQNPDMRQFRQLLFDIALGESDIDARAIGGCAEREGLGLVWRKLQSRNVIAFSFLRADSDPAQAEADLGAVIEKLAVSTEIGEQIARLDEVLKSTENWTEERFSERASLQTAEFSATQQLKELLVGRDEDIV